MTDWEIIFDSEADCLSARRANLDRERSHDLVPCRAGFGILVEYGNPHRFVGFQMANFTSGGRADLDLELISRIGGTGLAKAVEDARTHSLSNPFDDDYFRRVTSQAEPDEGQTIALLSYLRNCVSAYGWVPQPREDVMRYPLITDEIYNESDVDGELLAELNMILGRAIEQGTSGKASTALRRDRVAGTTSINVIPTDETSACSPLLLAFCFDGDDLSDLVNEAVKHAGIHCPATRAVVLATSKWDPNKWKRLERDVLALRSTFFVYLIGPEGAVVRVR
jgi:hypothetical protein